jgi:hypothetical protein
MPIITYHNQNKHEASTAKRTYKYKYALVGEKQDKD